MFYILYGQDDFSINQAVDRIRADLGEPQTLSVSATRLDGQKLSLRELEENCGAAPFLSSYRLVIVDGLLGKFEPKLDKKRLSKRAVSKSTSGLGEWEELAPYIKQMPSTTVLILIDGKLGANNPLMGKLSPLARISVFPLLRGKKLADWVRQRVTEEGGSITSGAVDLLVELIGGNLWTMNNEIVKLLTYVSTCSIKEGDVRQLVGYAHEVNVFALADAIVEGRIETAQKILHHFYQEGAPATYILAMITRQFRLIAQIRELSSKLSRQQIQGKLRLNSFVVSRTLSQANLYDLEHIKRAYGRLLETDLVVKTGKYNDQLALELLVAELGIS
ncbi:MAG: DNA polymerase III subunit delta [Dehalococcoidia bacterium]|nr:DNA polymerase III subunit delta [Dehalococcoidia bacterium]